MKRTILAALLVALPAGAEEMGAFHGLARVTCSSGGVGYAAARSVDMPGARWENRWRVELAIDVPASCLRPQEIRDVWIRTTALSRGSYTIDIPGWGMVEILPGAPEVRAAFKRAAPGTETRYKPRILLREVGDAIELLIEEPR